MNRMTLMRRICCVALALLMLFPAAAFAEKGKDTAEIPARFANCGTVNSLFKAAEAALKEGIDPASVPCGNGEQVGCWNEGYEDSFGVLYEEICSNSTDNGFFGEILKASHTKTVLCGHDHTNTLAVRYQGVLLMYGTKTGSGCYWNKKINGGTILTINSAGKMKAGHRFVPV